MNQKFKESYKMLRESVKGTNSSILWTAGEMDDVSYIECWLIDGKEIVIYQILKGGVGFNEYVVLTQSEKNVSKLIMTVNQLNSAIKHHPDCVKGSEFAIHSSLADKVIEETTGVKPKN